MDDQNEIFCEILQNLDFIKLSQDVNHSGFRFWIFHAVELTTDGRQDLDKKHENVMLGAVLTSISMFGMKILSKFVQRSRRQWGNV